MRPMVRKSLGSTLKCMERGLYPKPDTRGDTAESPAVRASRGLCPPAVQDAHAGNAVDSRLHPARPGCLLRGARVIEPEIDALREPMRSVHVVVLEERHAAGRGRIARGPIDRL